MSLVHLHLVLNHVPVIGAVFVLLVLLLAFWKRSSEMGRLALGMLVVIGFVSAFVFLTGEPAEEAVENLAGVSESAIHLHEDAATVALVLSGVLGLLSVGFLWWYQRREIPRVVLGTALIAVLALTGTMGWTANLGGRIRHTEIGGPTISGAEGENDH